MTHFGVICPASSGHLNTMLPLTQELQKRGHRLSFIGLPYVAEKIAATGLEFCSIEPKDYTPESREAALAKLGQMSGLEAVKYTAELLAGGERNILEYAPEVIKQAGIEALLVDEVLRSGTIVAEYLDIPFITICSALILRKDPIVPPHYSFWNNSRAWWARLRNQLGYQILRVAAKPMIEVVMEYRQKWQLPLKYDFIPQELAIISHQPSELEFPRENLPTHFHFTGPYHYTSSREPVDFPWEKLNGKPLIYASMGTLQNRLINVFEKIAAACANLDAQLIISLGGSAKPESLPKLAGNPLVVEYAPQLELLKKATLVITHAGMNTTLETLTNGIPMVAIPVTNDQPGVAARVVWAGAGEGIPVGKLTTAKLQKALNKVLTEDAYKKNAVRLKEAIERAGGVKRAADIVEEALSTKKPVLARS